MISKIFSLIGKICLPTALATITFFQCAEVSAIPNPAAVYCEDMGYEYKIIKTEAGEFGACVVDGNEYEAWDFFDGEVGQEYSYCARQGYDIETVRDGKNGFSPKYAVCVSKDKERRRIPMADLMNFKERFRSFERPLETELLERSLSSTEQETLSMSSNFDWRNYNGQNWMTPVKDQGACNSCWAFADIGAVEAKINIARNESDFDVDLSEQDLMSCSPDSLGCAIGGDIGDGLLYI
ncbi:MAG TPA: C1 family peptidase [Thermodesulfobacteriota bacterium]|nr:C1 family peptidase [Thermodesulfobacteriota bacterium]